MLQFYDFSTERIQNREKQNFNLIGILDSEIFLKIVFDIINLKMFHEH